jgi:hypothetical protein
VPATVITLSPRVHVDDLVRLVLTRVERDHVAKVAARRQDVRQVRQLRRLARRLASDDELDVSSGDRTDGTTCLTVFPAGQRSAGVWGDPQIG